MLIQACPIVCMRRRLSLNSLADARAGPYAASPNGRRLSSEKRGAGRREIFHCHAHNFTRDYPTICIDHT